MGNYPSHRNNWPVSWLARAGATVDDPPLPRLPHTAARTRAIRRLFLVDFAGRATIDDVGAAAEDAGLLDRLSTPGSMRETVMQALRPIATHNVWDSVYRPVYSPYRPPGPTQVP